MPKHSRPTTSKTIRFPADIAEQAKHISAQREQTFTEFVLQAVYSALEDLKENKNSFP